MCWHSTEGSCAMQRYHWVQNVAPSLAALQIDRPGARVFLLKFQHEADRNLFFW